MSNQQASPSRLAPTVAAPESGRKIREHHDPSGGAALAQSGGGAAELVRRRPAASTVIDSTDPEPIGARRLLQSSPTVAFYSLGAASRRLDSSRSSDDEK
jgi:hypothetical protein